MTKNIARMTKKSERVPAPEPVEFPGDEGDDLPEEYPHPGTGDGDDPDDDAKISGGPKVARKKRCRLKARISG